MKRQCLHLLFLMLAVRLGAESLETRIVSRIHALAKQTLDADSLTVDVDWSGRSWKTRFKSGEVEVTVTWPEEKRFLSSRIYLGVEIWEKGRKRMNDRLPVTVQRFQRIAVAHHLLDREHILAPADLILEWRPVSRKSQKAFSDAGSLAGLRLKRVASPGQPITRDMVETRPLIRRGDRITVQFVEGNLTLSMTGQASQDGWMGDRIRVKNPRAGKELYGRVVASGVVEI